MFRRTWLPLPAWLLLAMLPSLARADAAADTAKPMPATTAAARAARAPSATPKPAVERLQQKSPPAAHRATPTLGRTTIAPFPVPGDTSRASAERLKLLNVPRPGITTIAPLPPPAGEPPVLGEVRDGSARLSPPAPAPAPYAYPRPLYLPAPTYPDAARDAGIQGTVLVRVHVLGDGSVGEAAIVRSIPALDTAALSCAKAMKFAPPTVAGKRATRWFTVPVRFTLH